ncbi:hypothetical protein DJ018_10545 [Phenylobacterium deserti]|uniref:Glycosyl transferase family 1 domain-containing protein n=2 Tax=Phenylobacterium deserti TaxID=1914756 RepID=A0A328AGQ9_9CAUL|nr:hypothetical protein DJ018_10545 [Phenylobacterium deserti]
MRVLKRWPGVSVISILPADVEPAVISVATDWIYDPQLWDLPTVGASVMSAMAVEIREAAGDRTVVVALGAQNEDKGFHQFVEIWRSSEQLRERFLFVAAGKVASESKGMADEFVRAGGLLRDGFVSDEDMAGAYAVADLMWSCYGPQYNQASGIFGRAVQRAVPVVVRRNSYVEAQARRFGFPNLSLDWTEAREAAAKLLGWSPPDRPNTANLVAGMRARSLKALTQSLGRWTA